MFGRATIRLGIGPHSSYVSDGDLQHVIIEKTSYYYFVRYTHHDIAVR